MCIRDREEAVQMLSDQVVKLQDELEEVNKWYSDQEQGEQETAPEGPAHKYDAWEAPSSAPQPPTSRSSVGVDGKRRPTRRKTRSGSQCLWGVKRKPCGQGFVLDGGATGAKPVSEVQPGRCGATGAQSTIKVQQSGRCGPVSYTHLTLPTIYSV